ncbi:tetratricopeptide repeat protein [Cohnella sp. GCM10012308]|uniref:tetratricopeptide repeat protein n=1 Tax=Cohnella sp. GCM10012308 TaxID=3317329 RepID=UPI003615DA3E
MEDAAWQSSYQTAEQLIEWNRYKEALEETQRLLALDPEDADAMALAGRIYVLMDRHTEGLHWSTEALRRDPEHLLAWFVRVTAYYESGQLQAFQEALTEALRLDPYESFYYYLNANYYNKKGQFPLAKSELLRALEIQPHNAVYLALLSYVEALLGHFEESARIDAQAIRIDAETPHVLLHLAWAARTRGDFKLDETYMKSAVRLNPDEKQFQDEYLEALQLAHPMFRIFTVPGKYIRRMKPWQIWVAWIAAWILFRPLVLLLIVLYAISKLGTKALVHVRVFGWRRR